MERIQGLINAASDPNSGNRLTLNCAKEWLADYLEMHAAEIARFPDQIDASHWDLLAADYDPGKEVQFLAAYFWGDLATFLAGRGKATEVRDFFPTNPACVLDELAKMFTTSERWTTRLDDIKAWVRGGIVP